MGDTSPLTAGLISDALRRDHGLAVIDPGGQDVLSAAAAFSPDIVVLSESLESSLGKGLAVLRRLRHAMPDCRAIMLLDSDDRIAVVDAFRSGARGVFTRNESPKMLSKCIHKVYDGQLWASDTHLEFLLDALNETQSVEILDSQGGRLLSKREEDVVRCLGKGLTNVQIACELKLTENTVKNYLFRVFNKLGVSSRIEVVLYAEHNYRERFLRADLQPSP